MKRTNMRNWRSILFFSMFANYQMLFLCAAHFCLTHSPPSSAKNDWAINAGYHCWKSYKYDVVLKMCWLDAVFDDFVDFVSLIHHQSLWYLTLYASAEIHCDLLFPSFLLPIWPGNHLDDITTNREITRSVITLSFFATAPAYAASDGFVILSYVLMWMLDSWLSTKHSQLRPTRCSKTFYARRMTWRGRAKEAKVKMTSKGERRIYVSYHSGSVLLNWHEYGVFENMYVYAYMHVYTYFQTNIFETKPVKVN